MNPSNDPTAKNLPLSGGSAFVIVPFGSLEDAERWVSQACADLDVREQVLVTPGAERPWVDPAKGVAGTELTFEGGWRAKYAGSGTVVMARCENAVVPEAQLSH